MMEHSKGDRTTKSRGERPGVMLYFESVRPAIKRLNQKQCGALLQSLLDYAQYGVVPELDPMTGMAFDMLAPKIDRDAERYEESREQRQYAAYAKERKKNGETVLSIAEWRLTRARTDVHENNGPLSPVHENAAPYPSTSTTTSPSTSTSTAASTSPSTTPSTSPSAAAAGEGCRGEGEVRALYEAWLKALDARDNARGLELTNRLFALGYHADIATRELRKRQRLPGG